MKISKLSISGSLLVSAFTLMVSNTVYGNDISFPDTKEEIQRELNQGARKNFGGTIYEWENGHVYIVTDGARSRGRGDLADINAAIAPKMGIKVLCEKSDKAEHKTNIIIDQLARETLGEVKELIKLYYSESNFELSVYSAQVDSNCDTNAIATAIYDELLKSGLNKKQVFINKETLKRRQLKKMERLLTKNTAIVQITRLN